MSTFPTFEKTPHFSCDDKCCKQNEPKTLNKTIAAVGLTSNNKKTPQFICEVCDFKCCKQNEYNRHVVTIKHKRLTSTNQKTPNDNIKKFSCVCGNNYSHLPSLAKHKRMCPAVHVDLVSVPIIDKAYDGDKMANKEVGIPTDDIICSNDKVIITKELFLEMINGNKEIINENKEMMKIIKGQQDQITSMMPKLGNITNNNNTFNLNVFLNEKCKDALNISEFIDSLKITSEDLLFSMTNGISRGVTDVMIKKLKELDIYKRPIHCTDMKRDIMYIKDEDKWHKDDNRDKMKNTIIQIADMERTALQQWAIDNPDWIETEQKQIQYLTMMRSICEPIENYDNYERKIVKNVGREIMVDK